MGNLLALWRMRQCRGPGPPSATGPGPRACFRCGALAEPGATAILWAYPVWLCWPCLDLALSALPDGHAA